MLIAIFIILAALALLLFAFIGGACIVAGRADDAMRREMRAKGLPDE